MEIEFAVSEALCAIRPTGLLLATCSKYLLLAHAPGGHDGVARCSVILLNPEDVRPVPVPV